MIPLPRLNLRRLLGVVALAAASALHAQDTLNVNWSSSLGAAKNLPALNAWSGTDPAIAANADYKAALLNFNPYLLRLHSIEMIRTDGHSKSWLNSDGTWNATRIKTVLDNVSPNCQQIMITIPKWSPTLATGSAKLPADKHTAFANWCAELVNIVRVQNNYTKVVYFEVLNEMDGVYNGDSAGLASLFKKCSSAMRAKHSGIKIAGGAWTQAWDDADMQAFLDNVTSTDMQAFTYHHYGTGNTSTNVADLYNKAEAVGERTSTIRGWMNDRGHSSTALFLGETQMFTNWDLDTQNYMSSHRGGVWLALAFRSASLRRVNGATAIDRFVPWNDADSTYGIYDPANSYGRRAGGHVMRELRNRFSGGNFYTTTVTSSTSNLRALARSGGSAPPAVMMINKSNVNTVTVNTNFNGWNPSNTSYDLVTVSSAGYSSVAKTWSGAPQGLVLQPNSVTFLRFK